MPYITPDAKKAINDGSGPDTVGELTYSITRICVEYFAGASRHDFATHAEITAALDHARHEWFRRMVAPHEDKKMVENGDVYTLKGA